METYAQGDSNENAADCRSDTPSAIQSEIIYLDLWVSKAGAFLWLLSLLGSQRADQCRKWWIIFKNKATKTKTSMAHEVGWYYRKPIPERLSNNKK